MMNSSKIIGLTGNIATGKSVIRQMLANSGALGIDADDIAHRMLYPGAPAFQPVIDAFGEEILSAEGDISRRKLGKIVFADHKKLVILENLIHPWVNLAIRKRIQTATLPIVVIEAIKLFKSDLIELCDAVWVSHASEEHQMRRLLQTRNLDRSQAKMRITAQPPQKKQLDCADVTISTEGSFMDTWGRIQDALNDTIQAYTNEKPPHVNNTQDWQIESVVSSLHPDLTDLWQKLTPFSNQELYERLGRQMVLLLQEKGQCRGFILWDCRDFSAAMDSVHPELMMDACNSSILNAFERRAHGNQCEILLIPVSKTSSNETNLVNLGYKKQTSRDLSYPAWKAAIDTHSQENQAEIWVRIINQPVEFLEKLKF